MPVVLWLDQLLKTPAEEFVIVALYQLLGRDANGCQPLARALGPLFQHGPATAVFTHTQWIGSRAIAKAISLEKSGTCA